MEDSPDNGGEEGGKKRWLIKAVDEPLLNQEHFILNFNHH